MPRLITYSLLKPVKGVPYSRDHLRRKCAAGEFPQAVAISDHRIGWIEDEVDEWIAQKITERGTQRSA